MSVDNGNFANNDRINDISDTCICGRPKIRRHCPYCGYINYYGLKNRIKRLHPLTGEMTDNISVFRCRACNKNFDDLQWEFNCTAPPSLRVQQTRKREQSKQTLINQANDGVKFTDNDKRHFEKIVGMKYDEYMQLRSAAKQRAEQAANKLLSKPYGHMPTFPKNRKLTPLEYHIMNCNYCNTHDENCEVGKQLEIAAKMEQP